MVGSLDLQKVLRDGEHAFSPGLLARAHGGVLYVNFNGHAADAVRPPTMKPNGFGLCAFAALHIPSGER